MQPDLHAFVDVADEVVGRERADDEQHEADQQP